MSGDATPFTVEPGRFGRIVAGEDEGWFLHVAAGEGGFVVYVVDDITDPSAGGDHWTPDLEKFFALQGWRVEWLDRRCDACCASSRGAGTT